MFGLTSKLPISEEQRKWVDGGFKRLTLMLGWQRMLEAEVILPEDRFFLICTTVQPNV